MHAHTHTHAGVCLLLAVKFFMDIKKQEVKGLLEVRVYIASGSRFATVQGSRLEGVHHYCLFTDSAGDIGHIPRQL